jgi:hypothetical protein
MVWEGGNSQTWDGLVLDRETLIMRGSWDALLLDEGILSMRWLCDALLLDEGILKHEMLYCCWRELTSMILSNIRWGNSQTWYTVELDEGTRCSRDALLKDNQETAIYKL